MGQTRAWITLLVTLLTLVMVSACGRPEFTYVRDRDGTTYFKVPASFAQIDASSLDLALSGNQPDTQVALQRERRVWATAFDQAPEPGIGHLFDSRSPFVYATVHKLTEEQRATVSLDRLRDFILPVTEEMRTAYVTNALSTGRMPLFTGFEPISDRLVLLDNGARGSGCASTIRSAPRSRRSTTPPSSTSRAAPSPSCSSPAGRAVSRREARSSRRSRPPSSCFDHADRGASVTTLRMPLWDRSRLLAGLAVVYLVLTWQVMADFEGIMSYPEALRVIAEAHPWIFWLLGAEALRQAHGLIGERWSGYRRFWSGRVFGGFARWSRRRFSAGTRFRAARALKIAFWLVTLSLALGAVLGTSPFFALLRVPERLPVVLPVLVIVLAVAGLARFLSRVASRPTVRVTSPLASPTSGARTTCWSSSGNVSSGWTGPARSSGAAATCPAACCCGGRRAPARRCWPRPWRVRRAGRTSSSTRARSRAYSR